MRVYYRANAAEAEKLCEAGRYLADYLALNADPYDFEFLLGDWKMQYFGWPEEDDEETQEEMAKIEFVDDLDERQLAHFTRFAEEHGPPYAAQHMGAEAPAYVYFSDVRPLPPGTWLVHFTEASFASFDRGTTIYGLALSTWKREKDVVDCERNLSSDIGLAEVVYGFAYRAEGRERLGPHSPLASAASLGPNVLFFQTDCAVAAYHEGDMEEQVIFPLCTEYNVHVGTYDTQNLEFWLETDGEDLGPFPSPESVVAELEEAA